MTFDPDRLLITHVFQRIVNLLAGRTTSFDLARFCVVGAMVFQVLALIADIVAGMWIVALLTLPGTIGVGLASLTMQNTIARTERDFLAGRIFDPFQKRTRRLRWGMLAGLLFSTIMTILIYTGALVSILAYLYCVTAAIYFTDCIPAPPRRRQFKFSYFKKALSAWPALPSSTSRTCSNVRAM